MRKRGDSWEFKGHEIQRMFKNALKPFLLKLLIENIYIYQYDVTVSLVFAKSVYIKV